jgi:hypothetical protein
MTVQKMVNASVSCLSATRRGLSLATRIESLPYAATSPCFLRSLAFISSRINLKCLMPSLVRDSVNEDWLPFADSATGDHRSEIPGPVFLVPRCKTLGSDLRHEVRVRFVVRFFLQTGYTLRDRRLFYATDIDCCQRIRQGSYVQDVSRLYDTSFVRSGYDTPPYCRVAGECRLQPMPCFQPPRSLGRQSRPMLGNQTGIKSARVDPNHSEYLTKGSRSQDGHAAPGEP